MNIFRLYGICFIRIGYTYGKIVALFIIEFQMILKIQFTNLFMIVMNNSSCVGSFWWSIITLTICLIYLQFIQHPVDAPYWGTKLYYFSPIWCCQWYFFQCSTCCFNNVKYKYFFLPTCHQSLFTVTWWAVDNFFNYMKTNSEESIILTVQEFVICSPDKSLCMRVNAFLVNWKI